MKLALSALLVLATAGAARADEASATAAAKAWLDVALAGDAVAAPSKKAPLDHVIDTDRRPCRKVRTGHATTAKQAKKVVGCLAAAYGKLWIAGDDRTPAAWGTEALADVADAFADPKLAKKVAATGKGATIVKASFHGSTRAMTIWLAVGADDVVGAVYMREVLAD